MPQNIFSPSLLELQQQEIDDRLGKKLEIGKNIAKVCFAVLDPDGDITAKIAALIPADAVKTKRGFINFNCPSCCTRSGLIITKGGGFRFRCFRPLCNYGSATGWEPGGPIGQRVRDLYRDMRSTNSYDG